MQSTLDGLGIGLALNSLYVENCVLPCQFEIELHIFVLEGRVCHHYWDGRLPLSFICKPPRSNFHFPITLTHTKKSATSSLLIHSHSSIAWFEISVFFEKSLSSVFIPCEPCPIVPGNPLPIHSVRMSIEYHYEITLNLLWNGSAPFWYRSKPESKAFPQGFTGLRTRRCSYRGGRVDSVSALVNGLLLTSDGAEVSKIEGLMDFRKGSNRRRRKTPGGRFSLDVLIIFPRREALV